MVGPADSSLVIKACGTGAVLIADHRGMQGGTRVHPWWPHLFDFPQFLDPISWWWLSVKGYALTSSIGFGPLAFLGAAWWHTRCDTPRCVRRGKHRTSDGQHKLCRVCHPDLPDHKLSLAEIHERHHAHKERTRP